MEVEDIKFIEENLENFLTAENAEERRVLFDYYFYMEQT